MAVAKICGIETEYGIVLRGGGESNPVTASSLLINAYVSDIAVTGLDSPPPRSTMPYSVSMPQILATAIGPTLPGSTSAAAARRCGADHAHGA